MNILVLCEYSNIVSQAFRSKNHYVLSCDFEECTSPGANHYKGNCFDVINYDWDMIIGFPPCTYLAKVQMFRLKRCHLRNDLSAAAQRFFMDIYHNKCPLIAIENPIGIMSNVLRKPDQIISPNQFGSMYQKEIALHLKGLPPLIHTYITHGSKSTSNHVNSRMSQALKSKIKSKFFPELAAEMANQWG